MNFELLVSWMSHLGSGSWNSFKQAVDELSLDGADGADVRAARIALSDLGFADFFVGGTRNWQMLPSRIGSLGRIDSHVLVGGRSPDLIEKVRLSATNRGARCEIKEESGRPTAVELGCSDDDAESIAKESGLEWASSLAREAISGFNPLSSVLEQAPAEPPKNWSVRSFNAETLRWVDELLPNSACEFSSRFGERQFYVHLRKRRFVSAGKRESIFLGAAVKGIELVQHDGDGLSVPIEAPLPELLARAACCCRGVMSELRGERIHYREIPIQIAGAILAALGQRAPQAALMGCVNG